MCFSSNKFKIMIEMREAGQQGSIVTLICDGGERYLDSYYNDEWLERQELDIDQHWRFND